MRIVRLLLCLTMSAHAAFAADVPSGISIGQSLDSVRPILQRQCRRTAEKRYTGAMAAPAKKFQTQIDCYGLEAYGGQRKVEYMFNDGVLAFVWVLVELDELTTLETEISATHGDIIYEKGNYRVFAGGMIALRKNPPEVLIASPEIMRDLTGFQPKR